MDSFDINRLTDFDFEAVCKDIFESELDIPLEIFTPGRDGGIDLRYMAPGSGHNTIIQCKHWPQSTATNLIRNLKETELPKLKQVKPQRYILATSARLTPGGKEKITAAFHPYIISTGDIYGLQELVALLGKHPQIVRRHLRLWLSSASVLQALLNKATLTRSTDLADEIRHAALIYAPNPSYRRALEVIEGQHVCIISGIPGIGKTTLAKILAFAYANQGYELYEISEDADEINAIWDDTAPQFFYYDDFLGQTSLGDKLQKNEDSRLLKIMRRVNRSPNKRLVLTTREYILEQARQNYERISSEDFTSLTCMLSLGDYTKLIRAEILYNHIYFSTLPAYDKVVFANPEIYDPIIRDRNFSPRLIDSSIQISANRGLSGEEVADEIRRHLKSPQRLWEHIVQNQLSPLQVKILIVLCTFLPRRILVESLALALTDTEYSAHEFQRSLKVLEGTMTKTSKLRDGSLVIGFHNPSIRDFLERHIFNSFSTLQNLIKSAIFFDQTEMLWHYLTSNDMLSETLNPQVRCAIIEGVLGQFKGTDPRHPDKSPVDDSELFWRGYIALRIADRLDSNEIRGLVHDWFSSIRISDACPSASDLAGFVTESLGSESEKLRGSILERMGEIVAYIIRDTDDFNEIQEAVNALEEIDMSFIDWDAPPTEEQEHPVRRLIRPEIRRLYEDLDMAARDIIQIVVNSGLPLDWNAQEMQEILDHVELFENPEEEFPGYSEARAIYDQVITNPEGTETEFPHEELDDMSATPVLVDHIFNSLKETHNP
jgi:hypothetical protein